MAFEAHKKEEARSTVVKRPSFTADRDLVMQMLRREDQLRFCDETQEEYDSIEWLPTNIPPYPVEEKIQKQVLTEHGITPSPENLHLYRCINGLFPEDPQVTLVL